MISDVKPADRLSAVRAVLAIAAGSDAPLVSYMGELMVAQTANPMAAPITGTTMALAALHAELHLHTRSVDAGTIISELRGMLAVVYDDADKTLSWSHRLILAAVDDGYGTWDATYDEILTTPAPPGQSPYRLQIIDQLASGLAEIMHAHYGPSFTHRLHTMHAAALAAMLTDQTGDHTAASD